MQVLLSHISLCPKVASLRRKPVGSLSDIRFCRKYCFARQSRVSAKKHGVELNHYDFLLRQDRPFSSAACAQLNCVLSGPTVYCSLLLYRGPTLSTSLFCLYFSAFSPFCCVLAFFHLPLLLPLFMYDFSFFRRLSASHL